LSRLIDLAPDAIHVWTGALDIDAHRMEDMLERLSPMERARAARMPEERASRQFIISRAMQRQLLAGYVGGHPSEIKFGYVAMGKPTLAHPNDIGLTFNTTHSGQLVIIAVTAGRDVGVDVEHVRPVRRAMKVARRVFNEDEYKSLASLAPEELDRAFLSIWVRREGTAKARGDSVWRGLASWKGGEIENSPLRLDWRVEYLDLGREFVGVVVSERGDWQIEMKGAPSWSP
jgi:4'-phosphopantetheinyl transferase